MRINVQKIFQTILIPPLAQQSLSLNPSFLKSNMSIDEAIPEQVCVVHVIYTCIYWWLIGGECYQGNIVLPNKNEDQAG